MDAQLARHRDDQFLAPVAEDVGDGDDAARYLEEGDEFEMLPGFANFTPVRKGQPLLAPSSDTSLIFWRCTDY